MTAFSVEIPASVLASLVLVVLLASAGSEHQGPPGANLVCVIAEADE